jgi:RNA polymerase sigma-70 factor, ECF subfamily
MNHFALELTMEDSSTNTFGRFQKFEQYLRLLAATQLDDGLMGRVDKSGAIQQTLLEAFQNAKELSTYSSAAQMAWLRKSLVRNMTDEVRKLKTQKRDVYRERAIEQSIENSSRQLLHWLAANTEGASKALEAEERTLKLSGLILELPESQRTALMLHYWHRLSLIDIGLKMNRTAGAVAGLLKRALVTLREGMKGE